MDNKHNYLCTQLVVSLQGKFCYSRTYHHHSKKPDKTQLNLTRSFCEHGNFQIPTGALCQTDLTKMLKWLLHISSTSTRLYMYYLCIDFVILSKNRIDLVLAYHVDFAVDYHRHFRGGILLPKMDLIFLDFKLYMVFQ